MGKSGIVKLKLRLNIWKIILNEQLFGIFIHLKKKLKNE